MRPRLQSSLRRERIESGVHPAARRTAAARARLELALGLLAEDDGLESAEQEITLAIDLLSRELGTIDELRTQLDEREREIDEARREASRAKAQLLAMVSHELRTPLNAMLGYASMLSHGVGGPLSSEQQHKAERIEANGRELLGVIEQMLELAALDAGAMPVELQELDLGVTVRDAIRSLEPSCSRPDLRVELAIDPAVPHLRSDQAKIGKVVRCLVGNALKFTREGEVRVDVRRVLHGACIAVRDTGIGIAPEEQSRIFDPFHQVDGSPTRSVGGAGLGLASARRLVRLLGGDITLESALGEGSTFVVWLPDDEARDGAC
ncbi:Hypothetical protein I5071_55380 [Sandaracinus amylolyticus]|nr:Hypothetical protein I5071_55380 [Sandaracinus amylolyticus]